MPESQTILLVDDEDCDPELLTYPLERDGYRVVGAARRREALREVRGASKVDLVVLDVMLPEARRPRGLQADPRRRAPCRSSC